MTPISLAAYKLSMICFHIPSKYELVLPATQTEPFKWKYLLVGLFCVHVCSPSPTPPLVYLSVHFPSERSGTPSLYRGGRTPLLVKFEPGFHLILISPIHSIPLATHMHVATRLSTKPAAGQLYHLYDEEVVVATLAAPAPAVIQGWIQDFRKGVSGNS